MNYDELDIEGHLVNVGELPLAQVLIADETDTVLANSLRRIVDAARQRPQDTVAAFNNYI